ncbi:relaxin-3 receptor 1 [Colossoma macropomum]|uniref:relaxin-3 receptor 1 n=1 Tax=Colossoma macropomum TaxID=42526 RepID=UPI0018646F41|nr:relaxin-3 receptor 1 [Colossoma macropomum]
MGGLWRGAGVALVRLSTSVQSSQLRQGCWQLSHSGQMMAEQNSSGLFNRTSPDLGRFGNLEDIDVTADRSPVLRITISIVYSVVCAVGLAGNLLVFFLMRTKRGRRRSSIDVFIFNLALTDCQFVLTLPFWAVDTALDFSWPFGDAMCKTVLSVTVMNMYASVFFLTAMSVTRYFSVVSSTKTPQPRPVGWVRWACAVLWFLATVATAPTAIFSAVTNVAGEKLCLLKFPAGQYWLAFYHLQKILLAFVLPMLILSVSYCLLLRFVKRRSMNNCRSRRKLRVTKTVTLMVLSFFLCWLPNQAITFWGVLVKFNVIYWDEAYYTVHTYVFPASVCLAHTNSCLNPFIYCLMRREFRRKLKSCVLKVAPCLLVSSQPTNLRDVMSPNSAR